MYKLFRDVLTGKDNKTFDICRLLIFAAGIVFLALSIVDVFRGHDFKPVEFGTGLGLILTASAGGLVLNRSAEPTLKGEQKNGDL